MDRSIRPLVSLVKRLGLHPGAAWSLAWIALAANGLVLDPGRGPADAVAACVLGALFGGLTWIGALGFAGRRAPLWILPVLFVLGLARGSVYATLGEGPAGAASLLFEWLPLLAAAFVVWRAGLIEAEVGLRVLLTASLVVLAALEVTDGLRQLGVHGFYTMPYWLPVGLIAMTCELWAMRSWIARRELRLQRAEDEQRKLQAEVAREQRTNALLQRSEAWLFDFFEKAPDLLLVLTPDRHEIVRCNRRFSETLGLPRRDLVGRSLLDLVAPETVDDVQALLSGGHRHVRNIQLRLLRRDDSELVVLANLARRSSPDGSEEVRAVLHDMTRLPRDHAEDSLDLHRTLTRELGAGVFHSDDEGRCSFVNASFCELTGMSPRDAEARSWLDTAHGEDRPWLEARWEAAVRDRTVFRAEHRIVPGVGPSARVVTECTPISDRGLGGFAGAMTRLPASVQ
ncbi:MAG: PAS domain S-box protein, partial [Myxococcales bacterium]|nr:PAS domain S-box protein [Myxococcales bacterium]